MNCKICNSPTFSMAHAPVLGKFPVEFFHCYRCGFVQTETPYWLSEAYSEAIAACDVGLVDRNISLYRVTQAIISTLFDPSGQFLDWGGGFGLFVRLMRNEGFDFFRYDKYCPNIFSKGLDIDLAEVNLEFGMITAFEVFEHLENPMDELNSMLSFSNTVLFSTLLISDDPPPVDKWWYYALETGQHIAFYTLKSLQIMGREFGMNLYSNGSGLHMLTVKRFPNIFFKMIAKQKVASLLHLFTKRRSLIGEDYKRLTGKTIE